MDEPYPVVARDRATWQSDAERQADRLPPNRRRTLGLALGVVVAAALIGACVLYWLQCAAETNERRSARTVVKLRGR
jgi:hypothetical protein